MLGALLVRQPKEPFSNAADFLSRINPYLTHTMGVWWSDNLSAAHWPPRLPLTHVWWWKLCGFKPWSHPARKVVPSPLHCTSEWQQQNMDQIRNTACQIVQKWKLTKIGNVCKANNSLTTCSDACIVHSFGWIKNLLQNEWLALQ